MARPSDWSPVDMDSDPTPGDPDEVRRLADELQEFADDVGEALGRIRGLASERAVLDWAGLSADTFRAEFESVPGNLSKLAESYALCGQALQDYWPQLQTAQGVADRALDRAISAQADLAGAQAALGDAQDWVGRAGEEADRLQREGGRDGVEPPDEADVRAATRDHQAAEAAAGVAQGQVHDAEERLSAARQLAEEARETREEAARICARGIDEASDAGIQNRSWWEKLIEWISDAWDTLVSICKVIVAVLGVVVMIIGGPLAWVVVAAAVVVLADTLIKYARGEAGLLDVAFAALDCVPGLKGLTSVGALAAGARGAAGAGAARTGVRGIAQGARGQGPRVRESGVEFGSRSLSSDPVDLATGVVVMPATDVELPGVLPLLIERYHLSSYRAGRWFGRSWASTLDQRLTLDEHGVRFFTADGMTLEYPVPLADPDAVVLPVEGPRWGLAWNGEAGAPLTLSQPERGRTLHFAPLAGRPDGMLPLAAVTDRNGNRFDIRHDATGAPSELVHSGGYRVGITTAHGRIVALTLLSDPERPVLRAFGYDLAGNLAEVRDSAGRPLRFDYDARGRLARWEDRNGTWYRYDYDAEGRCVFATGTDRALEWSYSYQTQAPRTTVVRDSLGHATVYTFNDCLQLVAETDPLGHVTARGWDRYDRLLTVTDPLGHTTRHSYDEAGRLIGTVRPDGAGPRAELNELGLPETIVAADGSRWRQAYDAAGNRTALLDPLGNRTGFGYDRRGALASVTDPAGHTTRVETDLAGLPVAVVGPLGEVTRFHRDAFGRPVRIVDPLGGETRIGWTVDGRPSSRTDPLGHRETWEWDAEENLLRHSSASGEGICYTYGPFDLPTSQTGPDGVRYTFTRDTELNLTEVTDPEGRSWRYAYDAAGRLCSETDYDDRTTRYTHDAAGRVATRTNAAGQTVSYRHDALGELIGWTDGAGRATDYTLDPLGRVVHATSPGVELTRTFDPLGGLLTETVNGRTLTLGYDALGRLDSRTTPSGHLSSWSYDPLGQPSRLVTGGRTVAFAHDALGRETGRRIDGSLRLSYSWDASDRLIGQTVTRGPEHARRTPHRRSYGYRPDGHLTSRTDPTGTTRFTLDPLGRVTAVQAPGWAESYAYDATGNQTAAHWDIPGPAADAAGERAYAGTRLTRAGAFRYEHDAAGRVVLRQREHPSRGPDTWRYTWDAEDRLTSVTSADGTVWRYRYDPFGRRVAKERLAADGVTVAERTDFTWCLLSLVEQSTRATADDAPPPETLTWDYRGPHPVAQTERAGADLDRTEADERFYAIVTDLVGTPTHLVSDAGDIAWEGRAALWGATTATPESVTSTPLRFPGQYADEESGWHYNHFRHYDPATARYATQDPLGLTPAPNPYSYPHNPHTWTDPLGLAPYTFTTDRLSELSTPGHYNYLLRDQNNNVYYSGMFGGTSTAASTQVRHGLNYDRFIPANGDRMELLPGSRTYGEARLLEQENAVTYGTYIGSMGASQRGNRQWPLAADKRPEYDAYRQHLQQLNQNAGQPQPGQQPAPPPQQPQQQGPSRPQTRSQTQAQAQSTQGSST